MSEFNEISEAVINGEKEKVAELAQELVDAGEEPSKIISEGLVKGMDVVGEEFKNQDMYVPEVLISAESMHAGMDIVKPLLADSNTSSKETFMIGTVDGDLHDIGKNLVSMMVKGAGFEVIDIGIDKPTEEIVEAVNEHQPDVLGLSALLTTTMSAMEETIEALKEAGLRDKVKVILGGAPVGEEFANKIGADGYARGGSEAVDLVKKFTN